eukprot:747852-Hanusia_phi.AAC.7
MSCDSLDILFRGRLAVMYYCKDHVENRKLVPGPVAMLFLIQLTFDLLSLIQLRCQLHLSYGARDATQTSSSGFEGEGHLNQQAVRRRRRGSSRPVRDLEGEESRLRCPGSSCMPEHGDR